MYLDLVRIPKQWQPGAESTALPSGILSTALLGTHWYYQAVAWLCLTFCKAKELHFVQAVQEESAQSTSAVQGSK